MKTDTRAQAINWREKRKNGLDEREASGKLKYSARKTAN